MIETSPLEAEIRRRMPPLAAEIRRRIVAAGPMPVSEYMGLCLADPEHGYYITRDPLGARGDFITAPEVSQMFGELIGLWMAATWRQMGKPERVRVIELGPGRGTLMRDAMRAATLVPGFREASLVHLVEISPALRAQQERTLDGIGVPTAWHTSFADVPGGPALIVANEFFDALPIHQAVKVGAHWHERCVGIGDDGAFAFAVAPDPLPHFERLLSSDLRAAPDDSIFEWRGDKEALELGRRLADEGGAALVIDYGHIESGIGETLQAIGQHMYADPLTNSGNIDLTAHVDFYALARAVEAMGPQAHGPVEQGIFLRRLGIETRAAALKAKASAAVVTEINNALERLTGFTRSGMGALFKVAAFTHRSVGVPPGFER